MPRPKSKVNKLLSLKQVEEQTGIPISQLKLIKTLYPDGFTKTEIFVDKVKAYYVEHKEELEEIDSKSKEELVKQKLANEIILQEIDIAEARKQVIPIKEMEQFMGDFGIQLGAVLKSKLTKELPPQVIGLKEEDVIKICRDTYNSLVELFNKNLEEWNVTRTDK
jgi:hypothetical protein